MVRLPGDLANWRRLSGFDEGAEQPCQRKVGSGQELESEPAYLQDSERGERAASVREKSFRCCTVSRVLRALPRKELGVSCLLFEEVVVHM